MGQASTKSAGFYPPWVGPEKGVVWTLLLGLVCVILFVGIYIPFAMCPANDVAGICVPTVTLQALPGLGTSGLALYHSCPCNASTVIRTEPNARALSIVAFTETGSVKDARKLSTLTVLFAEFFLNDMYLPRPNSTYNISIPQPDPNFSADFTSIPVDIWFTDYDNNNNGCPDPVSDTTPFMDLSNVYGVDNDYLRNVLRTGLNGQMNVTAATGLLLFDSDTGGYVMADARDNDSAGLIAMHTLAVFWKARQLNVAEWQHIAYHEWLPALLGALAPSPLSSLTEYDATLNNKLSIEVAEVIVPGMIQTMTPSTYYDSSTYASDLGVTSTVASQSIDGALRRAIRTRARAIDPQITSALRSVVVDGVARDSAAETVQRDRVFRVPDWAAIYTCFGAVPIAGDSRDAFEGFLEEAIYPGASMGLTMGSVLAAQFGRTRDSDPLFYQFASARAAIGPVLFPTIRASNFRALLYRNSALAFADIGSGNVFFAK